MQTQILMLCFWVVWLVGFFFFFSGVRAVFLYHIFFVSAYIFIDFFISTEVQVDCEEFLGEH